MIDAGCHGARRRLFAGLLRAVGHQLSQLIPIPQFAPNSKEQDDTAVLLLATRRSMTNDRCRVPRSKTAAVRRLAPCCGASTLATDTNSAIRAQQQGARRYSR